MNKGQLFTLLFLLSSLLFAEPSLAEEPVTKITADKIDYFSGTKKYHATGSVYIVKEGTTVRADEMTYDETTADVVATGNVFYSDKDVEVRAARAEVNMEKKTGRLHDAVLFYKKDNYHLAGKILEKRGETYYYSPEAAFTTCDAPLPEWCFRGKEVDTRLGERLKARDATFRIKGVPVLYTPYLRASLVTERQTGFLMPIPSYSSSKGAGVRIPFYWAIAENRDATLVLDAYSRRGIGTGLEYRFVAPGGVKSSWWLYHIRDTDLKKDFWEMKAEHEQRERKGINGFLHIDYVNEKDFYREFSPERDMRTQRFLESTGEVQADFPESRLYLLSQYRVDLKQEGGNVPQKLPEVGYFLRYTRLGAFLFSASLNAANIWQEKGISAGRVDLYPRVLHSFGKDVTLSQTVALRETLYSFYKNEGADDQAQRHAFEYDVSAHTRLYKKYASFTHVIEPSVRYHFISSSENNLTVFDSTELFGKTSTVELSVLNRAIISGVETATVKVTQAVDTLKGDRPFLPLHLEALIKYPFPLNMDLTYNVHTGDFETISADIGVGLSKGSISAGVRYNKAADIMLYTAGFDIQPDKTLHLLGRAWYDSKSRRITDFNFAARYVKQCWGVRVEAIKKPGDFTMKVLFELAGLTSRPSQKDMPDFTK
ncbi:MAG: LPS-assembly protein LptD [Nitrospirae bacterium]|nr:LPS-assembly protein LptD [Nitrospirota bacterium]